jgi:hypothetical protein
MYGKKKLLLLALFLSLVSFGFLLNKTLAQTQNNYDVTISPVFFDLTTDPSTTIDKTIKIRNNTTSPIPIKLLVNKLSGDTNGNLTLSKDANDFTLSWIKFQSDTVVLKPLEWTEIPFVIEVPKDAAYGYYWTIALTQDNSSPLAKSGVSLTGAAAVPILLNVKKPGAKMQGKLVKFASDASVYEYPPVKLSLTFENTGNVHVRPHGNIFIKDTFGRQVGILELNGGQGTVLPNSIRAFDSTWDDGFITVEPKIVGGQPKLDKNGKVETELKIRFDKLLDLRIGTYTASALIVISTDTRDIPFEAQTSFFVFPWKLVLGVIIFVIFAAVGFYSSFRNFARKILKLLGLGKKDSRPDEN